MGKKRRRNGGRPRPASVGSGLQARSGTGSPIAGVRHHLSPRQKAWLRPALMFLVPAALLMLVELLLRMGGYGYPTRFFVRSDDGRMLLTNHRFAWRFAAREMATVPQPAMFPREKPEGTRRIFVLGGSAAQGTPAPAFGFVRILEEMLARQYPEKRFEVINAAMRGINSHVVLPIARDCSRESPDLFLIYVGNNETVGTYAPKPEGVHLTAQRRILQASQWLKTTKVAQLMEHSVRALRKGKDDAPAQDMEFFRRRRLAADHPRRAAVYENFRANLADICQVTRASGAKVIVSTVAVNLKDFPPLASLHRADLSPEQLSEWQAAWNQGTNAEARGAFADAVTHYRAALAVDDHHAELHFRLALCSLSNNVPEAARQHFGLARDWDALQFRTDSRLNDIAREIVATRSDPGLVLLDAEQAFADSPSSADGVPGTELFREHVHLNFDGDYLLARTFLPQIAQALDLPPPTPPLPSRQDCADALALTEWDEIAMSGAIFRMTGEPPFLDQLGHAQRQAQTHAELQRRTEAFQKGGGVQKTLTAYRAAIGRRPNDWQLHYNFGNFLTEVRDHAEAAAEYKAAVEAMPALLPGRLALAKALWQTRNRAAAIEQLKEALRLDPHFAPAKDALKKIGVRAG